MIKSSSGLTLGVDIGGTSVKLGLVDASAGLVGALHRQPLASDDPLGSLLDLTASVLGRSSPVSAIGIGSPGYLSPDRRQVLYAANLGWRGVDLGDGFAQAFGLPVVVEGDANVAALAEACLGAGREASSVLMIVLGTGIGMGLVIDGRLWTGFTGAAGNVGHVPVSGQSAPCVCGQRGCWEVFGSTRGLLRLASERGLGMWSDGAEVLAADRAGDAQARDLLMEWAGYVAAGLAPLVGAFDPELIVVGGAVSQSGGQFIPALVQDLTDRLLATAFLPPPRVLAAELGESAGVVGAGLLAHRRLGAAA